MLILLLILIHHVEMSYHMVMYQTTFAGVTTSLCITLDNMTTIRRLQYLGW